MGAGRGVGAIETHWSGKISEKVIVKQGLQADERVSRSDVWRKDILGSETSTGKGPAVPTAGEYLAGVRNSEESSGADEKGGRVAGSAAGERGHGARAR